jgi:hypothetical protein
MSNATQAIRDALDQVPVFDPHCHLRPEKPWADDLADIVLYHHVWIELISAGMDQRAVTRSGMPHEIVPPDMPSMERLRRALPYLTYIRNTTAGNLLRWLLQDLYGLDGGLDEHNLDAAFQAVAERADSNDWNEHVLRHRCRIQRSITVKESGTPGPCMLQGRERLPVGLGGRRWTTQEAFARYESRFGKPILSADDYVEFLGAAARSMAQEGIRFVGLSFQAWVTGSPSSLEEVDAVIRKARAEEPISRAESIGFTCFAMRRLLEELRATRLRTVQLLAGTEVLPPHRSIPCWNGDFTGALGRLAGEFEDFHFNVSTASDQYTQDIAVLAKHIPNISVAGHWWHTLYPYYIRKAIETRIDLVPMNKIIAFFSDAYHSEWCYPKLKLIKAIWAEVLSERVAKGWCEPGTATDLIHAAFYENPMRIYGGP